MPNYPIGVPKNVKITKSVEKEVEVLALGYCSVNKIYTLLKAFTLVTRVRYKIPYTES